MFSGGVLLSGARALAGLCWVSDKVGKLQALTLFLLITVRMAFPIVLGSKRTGLGCLREEPKEAILVQSSTLFGRERTLPLPLLSKKANARALVLRIPARESELLF